MSEPPPVPPVLRLPGDVKPSRESIALWLDPAKDKAHGEVAIEAQVVRPTRTVWLNGTNLAVSRVTLNGVEARVLPASPDGDFLGLVAPAALAPGPLAIHIEFDAGIDHEKSRGIYSVTEQDGTPYIYTFFESIDARRAFPCFDEPSFKIPWALQLHVKADQVARANAAIVGELPEAGGMKRVTFADTKPLPSYLVAFVAGPFEIIDDGVAGRVKTPIHFIVPKGRSAELAWAKDVTPRVVAAEENYFDMDYPYGKLDVAVVPRYWGTMEHPGIVAMGQPLSLIPPDQQTEERKRFYANILAHELGHYWFGDYVTLAWWDDTWLNESFGEWFDMIITDAVGPQWQYFDARIDLALGAMHSDEALSVNAIHTPVTTRQGIESSFDGEVTYSKGASILRMWEAYVTPPVWQKFIRDYLRAHAYGNANAADLYAAAETSLGKAPAAGLRSMFDQPGVPRISIDVACTRGAPVATIRQTRSLPEGVTDPQPKLWTLPVCFHTSEAARTCAVISQAETTLPLATKCPAWVIPNAGADGYYRSVVSPATLAAVMKRGTWEKLAPLERVMLLADVSAGVNRGEIPRDQVMALSPTLSADRDDRVAAMGAALSGFPDDALDDVLHDKLVAWQLSFLAPRARAIGWKRKPGDTEAHQQLRRELIGIAAFHDPTVGKQAQAAAARWIKDRTGVDDDLANITLVAASYRGDAAWFDALLAAAKQPRDRTDQARMLRALGTVRDPALANRALALTLAKDFDLRDSIGIAEGLLEQRETRDLALAFIQAHIDELLARMRSDEAMWFLTSVSNSFCDRARLDAVRTLVTPRAAKVDGAELAVKRGLEASEQCIANSDRQLPRVRALLHAK